MSRDRYGDGTLFRRKPSGNWHMQFYVRGRRVGPVSTGTPSRKEAARRMREAMAEADKGRVVDRSVTVGDLLDLVVADYQRQKRASLPQLLSRLKRLEPLTSIRAADFDAREVDRYTLACEDAGNAAATINRDLEILRRAFNLGDRRKIVSRVPYVEMLPENNIRTGYLEHADYKRLRECLREPVRLMLVIAYHVGARSGAIRTLRWEQVDFDAKVIHPGPNTSNKRLGHWPIYGDLATALMEAQIRASAIFRAPLG